MDLKCVLDPLTTVFYVFLLIISQSPWVQRHENCKCGHGDTHELNSSLNYSLFKPDVYSAETEPKEPTLSVILCTRIPAPADTVVAFGSATIICTRAIKIKHDSAKHPFNTHIIRAHKCIQSETTAQLTLIKTHTHSTS